MAAISGPRRLSRSLNGPTTSWPSARPATHAVSVSCTCAALACKRAAISGNAGRYMSIDSGPIAFTAPSTTTSRTRDARACAAARSSTGAGVIGDAIRSGFPFQRSARSERAACVERRSAAAGYDEPALVRRDHELRAVAGACLREEAGDMGLGRQRREHEALGDLGVRQALPDERQHLALARRELGQARVVDPRPPVWATNASMSRRVWRDARSASPPG